MHVKVDNWGIYFLQRLKHFFNRTDYCDLTLQFQDNAQLKVHRLVLSACTEYFELLERTCEMYEDCLVMPDDLQADVVVPIVNFMYTGQLEFQPDLLEKLYQTSLVMNVPVLSKLLDTHRQNLQGRPAPIHSYSKNQKQDVYRTKKMPVASSSGTAFKRSYNKAFEHDDGPKSKKMYSTFSNSPESSMKNGHQSSSDTYNFPVISERNKHLVQEPRPTRYELPEELDEDNVFDNSFTSISYTSKPLMVHPETVKQYGSKKPNLFEDASSSKRFFRGSSNDIVECRKISMNTNLFDDGPDSIPDDDEIFQQPASNKEEMKDASQLFDQIIESEGPKLTIEAKDSKQVNNIDHAKIISEVLKKYPHLMKSNKNIKVKILDTPNKCKKKSTIIKEEKESKLKQEPPDFTYESDVIDSKEAARLIALGAENIHGPWICLICGTPGRALHFTSYYKFRRHLVDIHNEKPVSTICEYCGLKSPKRNYLLHHLYTKHGVEPPSNYNFPKCNYCNYVALTEGFLVKHKMTHTEHKGFRCNVCVSSFGTSNQLLAHIQKTGHKYSADRKTNLQCIYCLKVFLRETNLFTHLKTNHKQAAKTDGIIDDSEEEKFDNEEPVPTENLKSRQNNESQNYIKYEMPVSMDSSYEGVQYQLEQKEDGNIQLVSKRPKLNESRTSVTKHKILNTGFESQNPIIRSPSKTTPKKKVFQENNPERNDFLEEINTSSPKTEEILLIDNKEYIIQNNQIIPKKERNTDDYPISNTVTHVEQAMPTLAAETLLEFQNLQTVQPQTSRMIVKKNSNINQPIQIVVSNEEEYKALMASNHSIFFEDGDPNKTLTVLTAQTNTPIETNTIDLETSQSNEMMIIPDNYPMSVAETVTADNSNIVVLYSHPIDDQNKQYHQHITSQGIEAQFIQSSAIITQNFETVTTCTPVMSAHVINTPVGETWQNNMNESINKLPITSSQTTIATVTPVESITGNSLNELPEVQLPTTKEVPMEINQQEIVTSNVVCQTINVYNQPEHTQTTHCIINEPNTDVLVNEEVSNDNILTSQTQSDIVNSLNLLEQNVMTGELQPQNNIIINNSTQMNLSVLSTVSPLCHPTDNDSNNDNAIASNIKMSLDGTAPEVEEHEEEIETTESIINNDHVVDNPISTHESQEDQMVDTIITNNSQDIQLADPITTHECQQNQTVEHQDVAQEVSNNQNCVNLDGQHLQQDENLEVDKQALNTTHNNESENEIVETIENIAKDIGVDHDSVEKNMELIHMTVTSEPVTCTDTTKSVASNINRKDDIQNLTSEWSEEESEISQEQEQETDINPNLQEPEMEESIENIQHEINKHLASAELNLNKESEIKKSSNQNEIASQNKTPSHEKISSLLNDWDDNDSQEEDVNTDQPLEEKSVSENENIVQSVSEKTVNDNENISKDNVLKHDNIKSLVSDWDEDEEPEMKD